jgi:hypothetical protein
MRGWSAKVHPARERIGGFRGLRPGLCDYWAFFAASIAG